jgi:hypothetical protein
MFQLQKRRFYQHRLNWQLEPEYPLNDLALCPVWAAEGVLPYEKQKGELEVAVEASP